MSWGTLRKANDEDLAALNAAARRFAERHDITFASEISDVDTVEYWLYEQDKDDFRLGKYYARLWNRCVARALKHPGAEGIAYGYVGYHVD